MLVLNHVQIYAIASAHFTDRKRQLVTIATLSNIMQGEKEILWSYIGRFP